MSRNGTTATPDLWIPSSAKRDAVRQTAQYFRKATPPALGPSFEGARPEWYLGPMTGGPQSPVLMFDLSRLTWQDYAEMRWHPQVNASLSLMTFMLHQMDWHIESEDKKAAAVVEENLRLIWTQLVRGLSTAYWAGYAPLVLEWENTNDDKVFISKVKDLHPGEASVNWKEVQSSYRPPPEYAAKIIPKVKVYDGISKFGLDYPIPPEHCVASNTLILCADLSWRRAGDLEPGDEIVSFDEQPTAGRRHYRTGIVEVARSIRKKSMRVSIQGREPIIATTDHPWLVYRPVPRQRAVRSDSNGLSRHPHEMAWVTTENLCPGDTLCHFVDPWVESQSKDAGWLAGMFDGEGCLSLTSGNTTLMVTQRSGPVLDRMKDILSEDGFDFVIRRASGSIHTSKDCFNIVIRGGRREIMRFLGTYRPCRWQETYKALYEGAWLRFNGDMPGAPRGGSVGTVEVTAIEHVGVQEITSLQTSTRTYIGGGFLMHNTLWYPMLREQGDYTGRKLLKAAFGPWFFSHLIHLYSNRYFERFGEPVPIARYPSNEEFTVPGVDGADDKRMTSKQVAADAVLALRSGTSVILPSDRDESASGAREYEYDIEYLESQMRGADFERYLSRLDEEISLAIFTPLLLLRSGERGSLNLGVQHTKTWLWSLNALGSDIKEYIDPYICERIKAFNFSPNTAPCRWVPRAMGKDNDETIRAMMNALISGGHYRPEIDEMAVALGISLEKIPEILTPAGVSKAAGGPTDGSKPDQRVRPGRADRGGLAVDGPSNTVGGSAPRTVR